MRVTIEELTTTDPTGQRLLEKREYDLSSRHLLTARVLRAIAPTGPILDIGGSSGLTQLVIPERHVISVDLLRSEVDVVAGGDALPIRSGSCAAVVALDVLEHVGEDLVVPLILEAARVADVVVFAGPYDDPAIRSAERHQRDLFIEMFGRDHPWLEEHDLPSLEQTARVLVDLGFETVIFGSNPLSLWSAQLLDTHIALRVGFDEKTLPTCRWLVDFFMDRADATAPSYRHFVVGSRRSAALGALAGILPGSDAGLVEEAIRRTQLSLASTIGFGFRVGEDIRADAIEGWEESVETIHLLEEKARQAPDERAIYELEGTVLETETWRSRLSGPVPNPDAVRDTMPDEHTYALWRRSRQVAEPPEEGPSFSVVTPVFNPDAAFFTECIRSVRDQTYPRWELVLVDASDVPHVRPIADRFATLDNRITILAGERGNCRQHKRGYCPQHGRMDRVP